MRSLTVSDSAKGLLVCIVLVAAMLHVVYVINRHAEEHGHCAPLAMLDVEFPQRDQGESKRAGQGVGHGRMVAASSPEKHVRGGCP